MYNEQRWMSKLKLSNQINTVDQQSVKPHGTGKWHIAVPCDLLVNWTVCTCGVAAVNLHTDTYVILTNHTSVYLTQRVHTLGMTWITDTCKKITTQLQRHMYD